MNLNPVSLGRDILNFLFPPLCPVCEERLSEEGICEVCWEDILKHLLLEPRVFYGFKVYSLFWYGGRVREAIEKMKYRGMKVLGEFFAVSLAEYVREEDVDVVVPLPIHPARIRERGFSQTDLIAKAMARELGVPFRRVIFRNRYTRPQALLGKEERGRNVKGAFSCLHPLKGETVLLIDDVITTGNTFYHAASALLKAGAGKVVGATLARGR